MMGWLAPVKLLRIAMKSHPPAPEIILASASPRRRQLLAELGCEFRVETAPTEELHRADLTAWELALANAYRKARAVAVRHPAALVIGADTLVYLGSELFGKPADRADAIRMLARLQGRAHEVVTGICLLQIAAGRKRSFVEVTAVRFRTLSRGEIEKYLGRINPLDKAGAYAIQESGELIVERIEGSYSNVVGFPMERVRAELDGWKVPV